MNAGERLTVNNKSFGYLSHRIVFYLLNLHIKSRHTYFARVSLSKSATTSGKILTEQQAGVSEEQDSYKVDASLSDDGRDYAMKMSEALIKHREEEHKTFNERSNTDTPLKPLAVWTSTRKRTVETSQHLLSKGYKVRQRSQMSQLNPGVCEKMSERRIREEYPDEVTKHEKDPYHHRYPRAEVREVEVKSSWYWH